MSQPRGDESESGLVRDEIALFSARPDRVKVRIDIPHGFSLEELERLVILQTLSDCAGNRTHAARSLGISVRTLQRRLKRWQDMPGLARPAGVSHGLEIVDGEEEAARRAAVAGFS